MNYYRQLLPTSFLLILLWSPHCFGAATTSGSILLKPPSARQTGMAEAVTALDAETFGISMIHYNPGSSAFLRNPEISMMGLRGFAGDNYATAFFGMPTNIGSLAGGFAYYSAGDIELVSSQDDFLGTVNAERDLALTLNYSEKLGEIFGSGINIRFLNSRLIDQFSANAISVDLGAQVHLKERKLTLGASVLNLGSNLKYINESESLPIAFRAGASHVHAFDRLNNVTSCLDVLKVRGEQTKTLLGVEYFWNKLIAFRTGYKFGQELGKLNFGLGFVIDKFRLDYAYSDAGDTGQTHSFSLTYKFGYKIQQSILAPEEKEKGLPKKTIAILNVQSTFLNDNETKRISDTLQSALAKKGDGFVLADRENILAIINQQFPQSIHCNDPACAVEIGIAVGADKVIMGSVELIGRYYFMRIRILDMRTLKIEHEDDARSFSLADMEDQIPSLATRIAYSLE